jgi:uncharacterized membrane protein (UPF0182 family)
MEQTLDEALARLFGGKVPQEPDAELVRGPSPPVPGAPVISPPSADGPSDLRGLAVRAREHYERAVDAQRRGDWATYGEELKQLGEALQQMRAQ